MSREISFDTFDRFIGSLPDSRVRGVYRNLKPVPDGGHNLVYVIHYGNDNLPFRMAAYYDPNLENVGFTEILTQLDPLLLKTFTPGKLKDLLTWWRTSFPKTSVYVAKGAIDGNEYLMLSSLMPTNGHSIDEVENVLSEIMTQAPQLLDKALEMVQQ